MCKLITVVKEEPREYPEMNRLMDLQWTQMKTQPDGCGAIVVYPDGKFEVKRSLGDYESVYEWLKTKRDKAKVISLHTRIRSSGGVNEESVHFFEDNGCYIGHNGFASKGFSSNYDYEYSSHRTVGFGGRDVKEMFEQQEFDKITRELTRCHEILYGCKNCQWVDEVEQHTCGRHQGEKNRITKLLNQLDDLTSWDGNTLRLGGETCTTDTKTKTPIVDTMAFLKAIPRPITKDGIAETVKSQRFSGAAFIFDSKTKKGWVVVEKKYVPTANRDGYSMLFSFEPTLTDDQKADKKIFGLSFYKDTSKKIMNTNDLDNLEDGVFELDYGLKKKK